MKKIKLSIAILAVSVLFLPQLQAREFTDIYTECGLGAMLAPSNRTIAAITNVTWDLGTTAVSTNISSPESCQGEEAKTAAFIGKSYDDLELEIASGEGKYFDTLATMSSKNMEDIRTEFSALVASTEYAEMSKMEKVEKLYNMVVI
ncbi:MAG: Unknown protein [uncultured Sulfurovum sp.]|uniref:DUF3015 domain-containing protein n=1 Tax=uncultured Sulfurovum sp. TaxID=269237 RepID=A0A6S6TRX4_9BACT|nr:MAG: Unknown protein [uncultured Sulfurovum sp.]